MSDETQTRPSKLPLFVTLLLVAVLAAATLFFFARRADPGAAGSGANATGDATTGPTVIVAIDFGDGVEYRYKKIPWREGTTVLNSLSAMSQLERGLGYDVQGRGENALITSIDSVRNEGGIGGRGWRYRVNGKLVPRSAGIHELQEGDTILWKFEVP